MDSVGLKKVGTKPPKLANVPLKKLFRKENTLLGTITGIPSQHTFDLMIFRTSRLVGYGFVPPEVHLPSTIFQGTLVRFRQCRNHPLEGSGCPGRYISLSLGTFGTRIPKNIQMKEDKDVFTRVPSPQKRSINTWIIMVLLQFLYPTKTFEICFGYENIKTHHFLNSYQHIFFFSVFPLRPRNFQTKSGSSFGPKISITSPWWGSKRFFWSKNWHP